MPLQFPEECELTEGRRQNVPPETWGWGTWTFLHAFAYSYPDKPTSVEKQAARNLLENLNFYLPCKSCRVNFAAEIKAHPLKDSDLQDATTLGKWVADLHNQVSQRLGKPVMPYEQRVKAMLRGQAPSPPPHRMALKEESSNGGGMIALWVLLGLLIVAVIGVVVVKSRRVGK